MKFIIFICLCLYLYSCNSPLNIENYIRGNTFVFADAASLKLNNNGSFTKNTGGCQGCPWIECKGYYLLNLNMIILVDTACNYTHLPPFEIKTDSLDSILKLTFLPPKKIELEVDTLYIWKVDNVSIPDKILFAHKPQEDSINFHSEIYFFWREKETADREYWENTNSFW